MADYEDFETVDFTVRARMDPTGKVMFLQELVATIEEGEFKGTTYCTNIGGGAPILSVMHGGVHIATTWLPLQDLLHAWLTAVTKAIGEKAPEYSHGTLTNRCVCGALYEAAVAEDERARQGLPASISARRLTEPVEEEFNEGC